MLTKLVLQVQNWPHCNVIFMIWKIWILIFWGFFLKKSKQIILHTTIEWIKYQSVKYTWLDIFLKMFYLWPQVESTERIVVNTPGYLKNLTEILSTEPKRNIANYMLWRATRASIGFMNKAARDVIEEYAKNITGKTETTPR